MKKAFILILCSMLVLACGSGGDDEASKSIFGLWTEDDNSNSFDLSSASFSSPIALDFLLISGEVCQCTITVVGQESEGSITINNCTYLGGGSGDPNCPVLLENGGQQYDYTKTGAALLLCGQSSCSNYR